MTIIHCLGSGLVGSFVIKKLLDEKMKINLVDIEEKEKINNYINFLSTSSIFGKNIITEVKKIDKFYYAEEYHQDYEKKNPYNPYVQNVSIPRFNRFKQKASSYIKIKDDH